MKLRCNRQLIVILSILFLCTACSSKQPSPQNSDHVGVATVAGTVGGVALGGMIGGMLGLLVTGATDGTAPLIGVVVGAVTAGSLGYGAGQAIDN